LGETEVTVEVWPTSPTQDDVTDIKVAYWPGVDIRDVMWSAGNTLFMDRYIPMTPQGISPTRHQGLSLRDLPTELFSGTASTLFLEFGQVERAEIIAVPEALADMVLRVQRRLESYLDHIADPVPFAPSDRGRRVKGRRLPSVSAPPVSIIFDDED
jgi:hypothetical protein